MEEEYMRILRFQDLPEHTQWAIAIGVVAATAQQNMGLPFEFTYPLLCRWAKQRMDRPAASIKTSK